MYLPFSHFCLIILLFGWLPSSAKAQQISSHHLGFFEYIPSSNGIVIAAPHGLYDKNTDDIAIEIAQTLNSGYVIARGFSTGKHRINVNRPTESYRRPHGNESYSPRSAAVYSHYVKILRALGSGRNLRLYVEIHGHSSAELANTIEIASIGLSADRATALKKIFYCIISEPRIANRGFPPVDLKIEPIDRLKYRATASKRIGSLSSNIADLALHIELPAVLRQDHATEATAQLIAFLITSGAMQGADSIAPRAFQKDHASCDSFRI